MSFGATVAGDVFQCKLDGCFGKINHVIIIADDILIVRYNPNHSDHNQAFINLSQTAQRCNVKLNYNKLQYKQDEVGFLDETYTTNDHKPAKSKVSAITSMPSPTNKEQVQSFIGMIDYLSEFYLRFSDLAEPIRELSKDKVSFNWGTEHQQALIQMKKAISSVPLLTYCKPKKQTTLQTDASVKGLGACLYKTTNSIFGSEALTDTQKGYVAIELESLAVAWAMEKFHRFDIPVILYWKLTRNCLKPYY